jgi:hypothetical protein
MYFRTLAIFFPALLLAGCYSFNGSSLPSNLKTVEIPLFANQSLEPNVADEITKAVSSQIVAGNLLRVTDQNGDASITGTVTSYVNTPYAFDAAATRQVNVQQYVVRITADVEFLDKKKNSPIFKGTITGEGTYDTQKESEQNGKDKAIKELVGRIMQSSLQGW